MENNQEDYGLRHVWGIKSYDDMSGAECGLHTMNDLDITYDIEFDKYMLGVENIYYFEEEEHCINYMQRLLDEFTNWMNENGFNTSEPLEFHQVFNNSNNFCSIEQAYTYFRVLTEHYIGTHKEGDKVVT